MEIEHSLIENSLLEFLDLNFVKLEMDQEKQFLTKRNFL